MSYSLLSGPGLDKISTEPQKVTKGKGNVLLLFSLSGFGEERDKSLQKVKIFASTVKEPHWFSIFFQ